MTQLPVVLDNLAGFAEDAGGQAAGESLFPVPAPVGFRRAGQRLQQILVQACVVAATVTAVDIGQYRAGDFAHPGLAPTNALPYQCQRRVAKDERAIHIKKRHNLALRPLLVESAQVLAQRFVDRHGLLRRLH